MIGAIVYQLTRNLSEEDVKKAGFDAYFVDHTAGVYPSSAAGVPFTAAYIQSKGDLITDLSENLAAEQKARTTYDNILRLATDKLNEKNFYAFNPSFDKHCNKQPQAHRFSVGFSFWFSKQKFKLYFVTFMI